MTKKIEIPMEIRMFLVTLTFTGLLISYLYWIVS